MPKPEPQNAVQSHIICVTCLRQFSEDEANNDTRKLFTEGTPFNDCDRGDALLKEAKLLVGFSEAVASIAANCPDTDLYHSDSILQLLTLLAEESGLRLMEAEILRESRHGHDAKASHKTC